VIVPVWPCTPKYNIKFGQEVFTSSCGVNKDCDVRDKLPAIMAACVVSEYDGRIYHYAYSKDSNVSKTLYSHTNYNYDGDNWYQYSVSGGDK
jgi:hypothetical protein